MKSNIAWIKRNFLLSLKPKFALPKSMGVKPKRVLDIGIANDSYDECKLVYPDVEYHGLDCFDDAIAMAPTDFFYLRDLENSLSLADLPNNFDLIIANHVLEHIINGQEVFAALCKLLDGGGVLYLEIPSIRTAFSTKRGGSYHFHDDPTHVSFYNLETLANIAIRHDCKILSCGPVSTPLKNFLSMPRTILSIIRGGEWGANLIHFQGKIDHIMIRRNDN